MMDGSESYEAQVSELMDQADELPYSPAKISLLEQAVRIADTHNDVPLAYHCRQELLTAAIFGGRPELLIIHFSWSVAKFDENPDDYDMFDLLWKFKWICHAGNDFPSVSAEQVESILADFKRRLDLLQLGLHPYLSTRLKVCLECGRLDEMADLIHQLESTPRTSLSDCHACVDNLCVQAFLELEQQELALHSFESLITSRRSCVEVPLVTYSKLFPVWLQRGEIELAAKYHAKSFSKICRNPEYLESLAEHLSYLVATEDWTKAAKAVRVGFDYWSHATSMADRWFFLNRLIPYLNQSQSRQLKQVRLNVPSEISVSSVKGKCDVSELLGWAVPLRDELAKQFDERNGNDYFTRRALE